jgi:hypothetical protein
MLSPAEQRIVESCFPDPEKYPPTRRVYTCVRCGHETLTIGGPGLDDSRCWMRVPDRHPPICGGELAQRWDEGLDAGPPRD